MGGFYKTGRLLSEADRAGGRQEQEIAGTKLRARNRIRLPYWREAPNRAKRSLVLRTTAALRASARQASKDCQTEGLAQAGACSPSVSTSTRARSSVPLLAEAEHSLFCRTSAHSREGPAALLVRRTSARAQLR